MQFVTEPWHWFLLGIALIVLEIFAPSFTIFWFGLAAIVVSAIVWIFPTLALTTQILIWVILSIIITLAWFKFMRPLFNKDHTKAGLPRESTIGQVGMIIQLMPDHNEAKVRFPMPILGSDEWTCRLLQPANIGDRVIVKDILGNQFIVDSYSSQIKNSQG